MQQIRILGGLFLWDEPLQIGQAHTLNTSLEQFRQMMWTIEANESLSKQVKKVRLNHGAEEIETKMGTRFMVRAGGSAARGISRPSTIHLDELLRMNNMDSFASLRYTLMAAPNPMLMGYTNAGDNTSVVLNSFRDRALASIGGVQDDIAYFEWSSPTDEITLENARHANPVGKQILYVKEYRPNMGIYSLPGYFGALNYIESDIEISKHVLGNAQTGFSASKLITLPNGEPSDEEKRNIEKRFSNRFSGSDGKKFILAFVNDSARKPIIDDLGASDITKEDFNRVDSLIQTNIFCGHQITTPSIFGIAEAGKLGSRSEMRDGYEIFKNTYVNSKQMHLESVFNMLAKFRGVQNPELSIIPTEPIGFEFTENLLKEIAPKEWLLEKAGIDMSKYQAPEDTVPVVQSAQFADDFSAFYDFGEAKDGFKVWKQKTRFNDDSEYQMFAEVSQLQANVLDLISKDKRITPEVLATTLDQNVETINSVIKTLVENGYVQINEYAIGEGIDENIIIEHTLTEPLNEILVKVQPTTKELLIRYSYEWKQGFNNTDKKTSRPFCVALLDAGKMYSRSEIEQISARLGYSVWDRGGGWYTVPGTDKHEPSCRHQWVSNIVTRK